MRIKCQSGNQFPVAGFVDEGPLYTFRDGVTVTFASIGTSSLQHATSQAQIDSVLGAGAIAKVHSYARVQGTTREEYAAFVQRPPRELRRAELAGGSARRVSGGVVVGPERASERLGESDRSLIDHKLAPAARFDAYRKTSRQAGPRGPSPASDHRATVLFPTENPMPTFKPGLQPPFSGHGFYIYDLRALRNAYGTDAKLFAEPTRCKVDHLWLRIHGRGYVGSHKHLAAETRFAEDAVLRDLPSPVGAGARARTSRPRSRSRRRRSQPMASIITSPTSSRARRARTGPSRKSPIISRRSPRGRRPRHDELRLHRRPCAGAAGGRRRVRRHDQSASLLVLELPEAVDAQPDREFERRLPARERGELCRLLPRPVEHYAPKPVVVSGQAYADGDFDENDAVAKLEQFFRDFNRYGDIHGLNWWHLGSATKRMRDVIAANM